MTEVCPKCGSASFDSFQLNGSDWQVDVNTLGIFRVCRYSVDQQPTVYLHTRQQVAGDSS